MASLINAAAAFVTIRLERGLFRRELQTANQQFEAILQNMALTGGILTTVGLGMGAAMGAFTKKASDAEEITNKFKQTVKGINASSAEQTITSFSNVLGRSRTQALNTAATFQGFFVGLGFGQKEAFKMSATMHQMTTDFASFNNIADDDAVRRFIGALSGSPETLDMFGFNVREAAVNQELLNMGLSKTTRTATMQQKTIAKMNIMMKTMGDQGATGDAIRTMDTFQGTMRQLQGTFDNFANLLGRQFIPHMKEVAINAQAALDGLTNLAKIYPELSDVAAYSTGVILGAGAGLLALAATGRVIGYLMTLRTAIQGIGASIATWGWVAQGGGPLWAMATAFQTMILPLTMLGVLIYKVAQGFHEYRKAGAGVVEMSQKLGEFQVGGINALEEEIKLRDEAGKDTNNQKKALAGELKRLQDEYDSQKAYLDKMKEEGKVQSWGFQMLEGVYGRKKDKAGNRNIMSQMEYDAEMERLQKLDEAIKKAKMAEEERTANLKNKDPEQVAAELDEWRDKQNKDNNPELERLKKQRQAMADSGALAQSEKERKANRDRWAAFDKSYKAAQQQKLLWENTVKAAKEARKAALNAVNAIFEERREAVRPEIENVIRQQQSLADAAKKERERQAEILQQRSSFGTGAGGVTAMRRLGGVFASQGSFEEQKENRMAKKNGEAYLNAMKKIYGNRFVDGIEAQIKSADTLENFVRRIGGSL